MKKMSLGLGLIAAALLSGCALGPQMQMSLPGDSAEYNGMIVHIHDIGEGDFGTAVAASGSDSAGASDFGDLKELMVDSLPELEYPVVPAEYAFAETTYGSQTFQGMVGKDNLVATQFHQEKSGDVGLAMLKNFCDWKV